MEVCRNEVIKLPTSKWNSHQTTEPHKRRKYLVFTNPTTTDVFEHPSCLGPEGWNHFPSQALLGSRAWGLGPGAWGLGPGARGLGPGAWGLGPEHGVWGLGPGAHLSWVCLSLQSRTLGLELWVFERGPGAIPFTLGPLKPHL